ADGDDGEAEVLGKQADAWLEGDHIGSVPVIHEAFGEDEEAVATIGGFAGEAETLAETRKLRKRENVEERNYEEVIHLPEPALGEKPLPWRMTKFAQCFAAHGGGQAMAETRWKRIKDEADIRAARGVIGDEEHRALEIGEMFVAANAGMAQEKRGGPGERVIDEKAKEACGEALRPAGIDVVGTASGGLREKFLDVRERLRVSELRFVEFDVVAVLESGEEFDTVERRQIFERGGE